MCFRTKDGKKWTPDGSRIKMKMEGEDTFMLCFDEAMTDDSAESPYPIKDNESSKETARNPSPDIENMDIDFDTRQRDSFMEHQNGCALDQSKRIDAVELEDKLDPESGKRKRSNVLDDDKVHQLKKEKWDDHQHHIQSPDNSEPNITNAEIQENDKKPDKKNKYRHFKKETYNHVSKEERDEVTLEDDRETSIRQMLDISVTDEITTQERDTDSDDDEMGSLIIHGTWDTSSEESKGKNGLRVTASCSVLRKENTQQTVFTAETDVGEGQTEISSIVHLKKTVEVEEYQALVSDSEEENNTSYRDVSPKLQSLSSKPALKMTKTDENDETIGTCLGTPLKTEHVTLSMENEPNPILISDMQRIDSHYDNALERDSDLIDTESIDKIGKQPTKSVSFDVSPELCGDEEKETSHPAEKKQEDMVDNIYSSEPQDRDIKVKDSLTDSDKNKRPLSDTKIGKGSSDLIAGKGAPPHIKKSNFKDGKTFIAMHKFVLEVEATAVPEAEATWFLNDKELNEEEDSVKFSFDGKKYILERIGSDPEHSGQYKCVLKNKIASAEEIGIVTVKEKEARVRRPLEDIFVIENTDALLKCQIVGDPIPTIEWLRNGKPLPTSERFEVSEERMAGWHSILVKGVTEQDKCTFTVKGKNTHGECETTSRLGILVKPQPGELKDATVDYGKDLLLNVAIHAFPPPKMVWTLQGRELVADGHYEYTRDEDNEVYGLLIKSAVLEDAGKITFTAENKAGNASGSCTVKVHTEKPSIVANLEHLMVCLEDDATFTFRASGLPPPECTWKLNDKVVVADDRHVFTFPEPGIYCLTIKNLNMNDYGPITVVGKSLVGECNSASKLSQKKLMCEIVEDLENVTKGAEGEDVTLKVKIKASPRPEFVWYKDGDVCEASEKIKIEMKKTSYCEAIISLTIVDAGSIESGQYRLKFMNELNSASTETALIIRPERRKPKVTRKPDHLEIMERKAGVFRAKITGFPKPEVKWMREGRQVYPTDIIDMGVTAEGMYYLEFRTVSKDDVGRYTVYAINDEGQCEAEASLTVVPPPSKPEFLQNLKASKVIMGYPVRLEVQLGGYPTPEVQWLKDGKPLQIDGTHYKQIVEPDGTVILQIDKASEADMGDITCIAKNPEGDSSSTAKLSVLGFKREDGQPDGPARFSEGLRDMCYDEGKNIRLPVGLRGGPVPNMKWYKDGEEVKLDDRVFYTYDGDRAYLEIRPCKGSDAGKYRCVIQNEHGKDETECEVSIRKCFEAPFFIGTFPNQAKLPGRDVKMSVKVDAVPKPELSWYFNDKPIQLDGDRFRVRKDGDGQTLIIKDCTYSDSGTYKVIAKNREGQAEHQAALEVSDDVDPNRRAEAPVFLKVMGDQELFEGSNALFKAVVTGKPEPEFKWTKNGGTIIPTNRVIIERDHEGLIRLTIKHISPEDAGVYQLKVWNEHGEASCQGKLICETLMTCDD
ncbi:hypothetical protein SK128_020955 [Halocaridina rubra]|uniref:Ig-like domain-containing protein n=1 Tax=Halocaridina rubra TaxID=373956 RepID=A0AAN8XHG5_HALRR